MEPLQTLKISHILAQNSPISQVQRLEGFFLGGGVYFVLFCGAGHHCQDIYWILGCQLVLENWKIFTTCFLLWFFFGLSALRKSSHLSKASLELPAFLLTQLSMNCGYWYILEEKYNVTVVVPLNIHMLKSLFLCGLNDIESWAPSDIHGELFLQEKSLEIWLILFLWQEKA